MSSFNHQQTAASADYPVPPTSYPPSAQAYVAPPPVGYPVKDEVVKSAQVAPVMTKSRGEGFWEGCCAALCCCCVLESCF